MLLAVLRWSNLIFKEKFSDQPYSLTNNQLRMITNFGLSKSTDIFNFVGVHLAGIEKTRVSVAPLHAMVCLTDECWCLNTWSTCVKQGMYHGVIWPGL